MIRGLAIIAVSGIVFGLICMGIALSIVGADIGSGRWDPQAFADEMERRYGGDIDVEFGPRDSVVTYDAFWEGAEVTRDFEWEGAGELNIGMPADVTYIQGPTPKITVTGISGTVDRFIADGEWLRLRGWSQANTFSEANPPAQTNERDRPPRLKIEVTAPGVTHFGVTGTETLAITGYAQDAIDIDAVGQARVTVQGSARLLELDVAGGAEADLSGLQLRRADITLSDSAKARVSASERVDVEADDLARLTLLQTPRELDQDVTEGAIVEQTGGAVPAAPATPAAPAAKAGAAK